MKKRSQKLATQKHHGEDLFFPRFRFDPNFVPFTRRCVLRVCLSEEITEILPKRGERFRNGAKKREAATAATPLTITAIIDATTKTATTPPISKQKRKKCALACDFRESVGCRALQNTILREAN